MNRRLIITLSLALCLSGACTHSEYQYPFQDPKLSPEKRVDNLMSLLTTEEKISLLVAEQPAIERLGIPAFEWGNEACHGIRQKGATVFPQSMALAASFDKEQNYEVFSAVSDEARATWNQGYGGISFWTPNINIVRDPRWGRSQETYGEDPYLSGVMGSAVVNGLQGNDSHYLKTAACAKHYAVHSGPEPLRHRYNPSVSDRDLWDTYLPAFKTLVQKAGVSEVMCAYTRFEGKPCCASDKLLTGILRDQWGFDGIVVTDCGAIGDFYEYNHHMTHKDGVDASADAILSGTNIECGTIGGTNAFVNLGKSLEQGLVKEEDIDRVLRGALLLRIRLGNLDPAELLPWKDLGKETMSSEEHHQLALKAARESMTLLANDGTLPLKKDLRKILVVGPNADAANMHLGNYNGTPTEEHTQSILSAIREAVAGTEVRYVRGCGYAQTEGSTFYFGKHRLKSEYFDGETFSGKPIGAGEAGYINLNPDTPLPEFLKGHDSYSIRYTGEVKVDTPSTLLYVIRSNMPFSLKVNGREIAGQKEVHPEIGYDSVPDMNDIIEVEPGKKYGFVLEFVHPAGEAAHLYFDLAEQHPAPAEKVEVADEDAIIFVGGLNSDLEGEQACILADGFNGGDRTKVELPVEQQDLIRKMHATGKPVVVVNCSGSAVTFTEIEDQYNALLQAFYGGEAMGQAIADVLFGNYNPAGRLPVTVYASTDQLPEFKDYNMEGRTYRYLRGEEPEFPFGYGLSYTTFEYGQATLSAGSVKAGKGVDVTIPVTNTGAVAGDEVVQVYIRSLDDPTAPVKELKGFERVNIEPGQTAQVKISLAGDSFERYDLEQKKVAVHKGRYQILYGSSSRDADLSALDFEIK
ncbi:MAG: glycoside hydrolase family 3 C-terminal domain-containing protein [Bacteroidales bacterium]|nr:glycoside hydrolase family 3 C-terminal domain-containing protein [Bacteroidales bacterium]